MKRQDLAAALPELRAAASFLGQRRSPQLSTEGFGRGTVARSASGHVGDDSEVPIHAKVELAVLHLEAGGGVGTRWPWWPSGTGYSLWSGCTVQASGTA